MTRIPEDDRNIMESSFYLPMLLKVLERDRLVIEKTPLKLQGPYLNLIEETIKAVHMDLKKVNQAMRKEKMKVQELNRDEAFTMFAFFYKGYEEHHNYFNPRLRNKVNELLEHYLYKRFNNET